MKRILTAVCLCAVLLGGCGAVGNDAKVMTETETEISKETAIDGDAVEKNLDAVTKKDDSETATSPEATEDVDGEASERETEEAAEKEAEVKPEEAVEEVKEEIDLQVVKPNELGEIMIVMYHSLRDKEGYMIRSVENFKQDLQTFYDKGYRLISMEDYLNNNINVEAGYTPVVFTFDDGHWTNFNLIEDPNVEAVVNADGEKVLDPENMIIDPESVVGIMKAFYEEHEDFGLEGIFYLNGGEKFGKDGFSDYKVKKLIELGMEVGNHTYGHEHLNEQSRSNVEKTIGKNAKQINDIVPEVTLDTLALPFGQRPKESYLDSIYSGEFEGYKYQHRGILNVGWKPEKPVVHTKFNWKSINRTQAGDGEFQLKHWLEYFDNNPGQRYISDGDAETITIKEKHEKYLNKEATDLEIRTYKLEE